MSSTITRACKYSTKLPKIIWFYTFRPGITRYSNHTAIMTKFFKPENSFAVFYDQLYTLLYFPRFNCTLNGTGN